MMYAIPLLILAYTCDPALAALFTPASPRLGSYEVCTTEEPIEAVSGGASIETTEALDAFGAAGPYNRSALARLYAGNRVRVVRRWRERPGVFVSETLVSPYPNASLTRLAAGTMVIRWTLDVARR
jgi:hypothetical protein